MNGLLKNDFTTELLQELLTRFCSDVASVMLETKSRIGRVLEERFSHLVLWHNLNHKLQLAVGNEQDITRGTHELQLFLESSHSLYNQSPKNIRALKECPMFRMSCEKNRKSVYCLLGGFIFQRGISNLPFFSSISATF